MSSKSLARLRAKTDCELAILITRQLQRSRALAQAGEYREACDLYVHAVKLLRVTAPAEAASVQALLAEVRPLVELPLGAIA
jgi:hypothetical protein